MRLNKEKLANLDPEILYDESQTTLLHSLEAFVGIIDFNRLGHQKRFGGTLASPSLTAAYLMNISTWDPEAEDFLRACIFDSSGRGSGGVPSAFPSTTFEITWITTTLLQNGFTVEDLGQRIAEAMLSDADDTAKSLLALYLCGEFASPGPLLSRFGSKGYLQTYLGERNSSFSANCNVLKALLHSPNPCEYQSWICSITNFLSDSWWKGEIKDKWNLSPEYSMMLLSEALIGVLQLWDKGLLKELPKSVVYHKIPVILVQILNRLLFSQSRDGSWGLIEVTAYTVSTLTALSDVPHLDALEEFFESAIKSGKEFLKKSFRNDRWSEPQYIWVEKVTYGSSNLLRSYCLAALKASRKSFGWSDDLKSLRPDIAKILGLTKFYRKLPKYSKESWKIKACVLEGLIFLPQLKSTRLEIFPVNKKASEQYLEHIPVAWVLVNNCEELLLSSDLLWDMMEISLLDFLVDEYMESMVIGLADDDLKLLEVALKATCDSHSTCRLLSAFETRVVKRKRSADTLLEEFTDRDIIQARAKRPRSDISDGMITPPKIQTSSKTKLLLDVKAVFETYISFVMNHPYISGAATGDKHALQIELEAFLIAYIVQIRDNNRLASQETGEKQEVMIFTDPQLPYYSWAHTIASKHISAPLSFSFYTCLLSCNSTTNEFSGLSSAYERYLAQELSSHLAVMSRLYNDFSSIARDFKERNLNTVNFPEFHEMRDGVPISVKSLKKEVLALASYEKACMLKTAQELEDHLRSGIIGGRRMSLLEVSSYNKKE
ncbi:hypothetical protein EAE99_009827 [Botrytis elliptica]|nr:hypothetical protein EAE99_009827 [Botrytis elliptica]